MNTNTPGVRPANLADWMLARGRSSATTAELSELLGLAPDLVRVRLNPYVHRGQWVSPARRLWVPVPVEYRLWGAPEGIEIIDTMMRHLDVLYYVGWLTAAALHGAAHHAPQVFQVAVSRHVAHRQVGRTRFRFATRENVPALPVIERTTRSGVARVSTPEVTVLDLASDLALAGGIDNAATVILGLAEDGLDVVALAELSRIFPAAAVRRTGWILETIGGRDDLQPLAEAARSRKEAASLLAAPGPKSGTTDRRWSLRVNADVDAEF
jgi:predicted transcriptional regulator of viral defense system